MEEKSKRSTWESFANWLEKEAKICESKQRWMLEKREWRRFDSTRSDLPKNGSRRFAGNPVPGLFAGATQETPSGDEKLTKKCPVHNSTIHALEECKKFKELPTLEKEKLVEEHKLCLSCLLPGHRLKKCNAKNGCKVEDCAMRHHTLVQEIDLNITERSRARKAEKLAVGEGAQKPFVPEGNKKPLNPSEKLREQCHHSVCLGCEAGGRALVEVLPVVLFSEKGEQQGMALRDSGRNTTLMDEELAQ